MLVFFLGMKCDFFGCCFPLDLDFTGLQNVMFVLCLCVCVCVCVCWFCFCVCVFFLIFAIDISKRRHTSNPCHRRITRFTWTKGGILIKFNFVTKKTNLQFKFCFWCWNLVCTNKFNHRKKNVKTKTFVKMKK